MTHSLSSPRLDEKQKIAWLRLIRSENVGPITFRSLINRFGGAVNALSALPELSASGGMRRCINIFSSNEAECELERSHRAGLRLIAMGEPEYPNQLIAIDSAPPLLYVSGNNDILSQKFVAIVGSRNCSALGRKMTTMIASELGTAGFGIVSGFARGIDAIAHETALDSGTAAVLAGGANIIYPPENKKLYERLKEKGVFISERPPDFEPKGRDFPRRNRIISGMALGTLIIEAAVRSGSLITARMAAEQGREVLAVPGSPLDPRAEGANTLIREGATLIRSADDVIDAITPLCDRLAPEIEFLLAETTAPSSLERQKTDDSDRVQITNALGPSPVSIDDIIRHTNLPAGVVLTVLLEMELAGRIIRHERNCVSSI
ncbi:MAG: DNA-processing protein DprA [Alphaproteobacteria bacterium]|nr:DNA-processing protein DprA [Alphaproteobacteria bacterium]